MTMKSNPLLSLCMIVKNEAQNLPHCLNDIQSVVDEIIVVDTGSSDNTVEIAKASGAQVYRYGWQNDFSAARNASIEHAAGDYILWLDADDRISPDTRNKLLDLKKGLSFNFFQAYALKVVCKNSLGESAHYYQIRIFPNNEKIRFKGAVHEQVLTSIRNSRIQVIQKEIEIEHTGYDRPEDSVNKAERNLSILLNSGNGKALTPSEYCQVARCYFGLKDYERCVDYLERARKMTVDGYFDKSLYSLLADSYLQLGQGENAVQSIANALERYPSSGYINYLLGAALTITENYQRASFHLREAARTGVEVEGFAVLSNIDARIAYYRGRCLEGMGRFKEALASYEKALESRPNDQDLLRSYGMILIRFGRLNEAVDVYEKQRKIAPSLDGLTWHTLSKLYLFFKKPDKSQKLYLEIVKEYPQDMDALVGLVTTSYRMGKYDHFFYALTMMQNCLRITPGFNVQSPKDAIPLITDMIGKLEGSGDKTNISALTAIRGSLESRMYPA